MREFELVPGGFTPEEKKDIDDKIKKWREDPSHVPKIRIPMQETVQSLRENGQGESHDNIIHALMFELGHE